MDRSTLKTTVIVTAAAVLFALAWAVAGEASMNQTGQQWLPVEFSVNNPTYSGNPFDLLASATFVHPASGETRTTGMYYDGGTIWKFRFTGTRPGLWTFTTSSSEPDLNGLSGTVNVEPAPPDRYGFVTNYGNKWVRPKGAAGNLEAFVPQYVMFGHPVSFYEDPGKVDADIQTFFVGHGFNGFHTGVACRWFDIYKESYTDIPSMDPNPDFRTFEALEQLFTKVHAAGGVVHLWKWGDEDRKQTPIKWGVNGTVDKRLQRYIAARLGPLPGWTMGYGFDNWEWVQEAWLDEWHAYMNQHFGWPHMLGCRNYQFDQWEQLSEVLDYSSYEQWRPDYNHYVLTMEDRPTKPSFSEDRFRVRDPSPYPEKDYTELMTRRGLWHSAMAGGVANIWGYLIDSPPDWTSAPYPNPHWIHTNAVFFKDRFHLDLIRDNSITNGVCLRTPDYTRFLFYREGAQSISMDLSNMPMPLKAVAVNASQPYNEISLGILQPGQHNWVAPGPNDWAIAVEPVTDVIPPDAVSGFTAIAGDKLNVLSWLNPTSGSFSGTMIRYKTSGYPTGPNDGILVVDKASAPGSSDSYVHTDLDSGVTYYYSAFAHDLGVNCAPAAQANATAGGAFCFIEPFAYPNGSLNGNGGWSGTATEQIVVEDQTLKVLGGSGAVDAIRNISCGAGPSGDIWVHTKVQPGTGSTTFFWSLWIDDPAGKNLARWYGKGTTARGRIGNEAIYAVEQNLIGGWNDLKVKITPSAKTSEFFLNGASTGVLSHNVTGATDTVGRVRFQRIDSAGAVGNYLHFDNLAVGGYDITPMNPASGFSAEASSGNVSLSWTNPLQNGFVGTMIRYKTSGYPANPADGDLVVVNGNTPGSSDGFVHSGLINGLTYYYSAFAYYGGSNYAAPVFAQAAPSNLQTISGSSFDAGTDGWNIEVWRSNPANPFGTMAWNGDLGNPGGCMRSTGVGDTDDSDRCLREGGEIWKVVSTEGYYGIKVSYDLRAGSLGAANAGAGTGSCSVDHDLIDEQLTVFYSIDGGTNWIEADWLKRDQLQASYLIYGNRTIDLSGIAGAIDNPNFALRFRWQFNGNTLSGDYGDLDNIVVRGISSGPISGIKNLPDGESVSLIGKALYLKGAGFGYIEEQDRSSGIRIEGSISADDGDLVTIGGTMQTTAGGERYVQVDSVTAVGQMEMKPLGVNNRSLAEDLAEGLFVRVWGVVKAGSITSNSFIITDGSNDAGVLVRTEGTPEVSEGEYVSLNGAAGYDGGRVIYAR